MIIVGNSRCLRKDRRWNQLLTLLETDKNLVKEVDEAFKFFEQNDDPALREANLVAEETQDIPDPDSEPQEFNPQDTPTKETTSTKPSKKLSKKQ